MGHLQRKAGFNVVVIGERDQRLKPQSLDLPSLEPQSRRRTQGWRPVGARKIDRGASAARRLLVTAGDLGDARDPVKITRKKR